MARIVAELEATIQTCLDDGRDHDALTAAVRGYGPAVLGFLISALRAPAAICPAQPATRQAGRIGMVSVTNVTIERVMGFLAATAVRHGQDSRKNVTVRSRRSRSRSRCDPKPAISDGVATTAFVELPNPAEVAPAPPCPTDACAALTRPIDPANVHEPRDTTRGMVRTEVPSSMRTAIHRDDLEAEPCAYLNHLEDVS